MTEIIAAHLERVAKELAQWLGRPQSQAEIERRVVAALAACAREAKLEVLHRLPAHAWPDKTTYPQKWGAELRNALQDELFKAMDEVALERAAGEKA